MIRNSLKNAKNVPLAFSTFIFHMHKKMLSFQCRQSSPCILASPKDDFSQLFCRALGVSTTRELTAVEVEKAASAHFLDTCHRDGRRESPRYSVVLWKSWQKHS